MSEKKTQKKTVKKERKEGKKEGMSKYEKLVVILSAISLLTTFCNIYLIYQTNQIMNESRELQSMMYDFQNMLYNFTSVIIPKTNYAILDLLSSYSRHDNVTTSITNYGYLNVELQVITPHYGKVSIECKYFEVGDSPLLDIEKRNQTNVSFASEYDKYEYLVYSGINSLNNQVHLKAYVHLNVSDISPETQSVQFPIGYLFLEAELLDIQTNTTLTKEFSSLIAVVYKPQP